MSAIPENVWGLAHLLHNARMKECYGNRMDAPSRRHWPKEDEVTRHNYGHKPSPHVDMALAQAKAALKWFESVAEDTHTGQGTTRYAIRD